MIGMIRIVVKNNNSSSIQHRIFRRRNNNSCKIVRHQPVHPIHNSIRLNCHTNTNSNSNNNCRERIRRHLLEEGRRSQYFVENPLVTIPIIWIPP